jgi:hypothetical protein
MPTSILLCGQQPLPTTRSHLPHRPRLTLSCLPSLLSRSGTPSLLPPWLLCLPKVQPRNMCHLISGRLAAWTARSGQRPQSSNRIQHSAVDHGDVATRLLSWARQVLSSPLYTGTLACLTQQLTGPYRHSGLSHQTELSLPPPYRYSDL